MDEKKLISLVQSNEHIYNKFVRDYKLVKKKKETWSKIALLMGQSEEICMKRWTSLRDRYVREKRLGNKEPDRCSSSVIRYSFPHLDSMAFLDQYVTSRPNRSSKYVEHNVSLPSLVEIAQHPFDSAPCYTPLSSPIQQSPQSPNSEPEIILTNKRKRKLEEPIEPLKMWNEALDTFKNACITREEISRKEEEENNVLYSFKKMIVATIGSLSIMKQAKAMQQVTDVVMRIKMETAESGEIISEYFDD